jgi:hypothetical protein
VAVQLISGPGPFSRRRMRAMATKKTAKKPAKGKKKPAKGKKK